jgi:hypothetical protein
MNLLALIIGILVSLIIIVRFKKTRLEKSGFSYSLLLFTLPLYYFMFAIYGSDYEAVPLEIFAGIVFFVIAIAALKLNASYKFSLLAMGYLIHGVYDATHNLIFTNMGMPAWWPEFCGAIDIIVGLYLLYLAYKYRVSRA